MTHPSLTLAEGMRLARLDYSDLWSRYLALGGSGTPGQLRDHVASPHCPDDYEHKIIAQALNDTYLERGHDHPVAYHHLEPPRCVWRLQPLGRMRPYVREHVAEVSAGAA